jgi:hypothetical protein
VKSIACAVLLVGLSTSGALADSVIGQLLGVTKACFSDIRSLCSGSIPGGSSGFRCLAANSVAVSAPCRDRMVVAMHALCSQDLARLCPGMSAGDPSAAACLKSHAAELTGTCKTASNKIEQR